VRGHNFPAVNQRVREAMEKIDLVGTGTIDLEIELAQKICQHVPSAEKVVFCNSGSEATYSALRLARAVTGRKKIIKFQGCYHGWHDSVAMNVMTAKERLGKKDPLSAGSLPAVLDETVVCEFNDLGSVEQAAKAHRGEVAAIIVEPIPHNIGCVMPEAGFLEGLKQIARQYGMILIFDEVITGFRHHLGGYQSLCGVTPDLTTLGKAMANGFPMAALCGKADLLDRFNTTQLGNVFFAGTYNGHAWACAAALATIESMESQGVHAHIFRLGEKVRKGLAEISQRLKLCATQAGFGSIYLTYFMDGPIRSYRDLLRNDQELFVRYRRELLEHGIFELPLNLKRNHISFSHTDEHIEKTLQATEDVLGKILVMKVASK
jgi:glutamate-1-semialdehyde 2,1-aminomutase